MAKVNLNETEKNKTKTITAWKLKTHGIVINKNYPPSPLFEVKIYLLIMNFVKQGNVFSNFSCMFLNPNIFFQFEL